MKTDLRLGGSWQKINEELKNRLSVADPNTAKLYLGIGHALTEVTQGLVRIFPHKKKVFYFKNMDPYFEPPMKELAKIGIKVVPLSLDDFNSPESWAEQVDREALMVLYSQDDPLLGKLFETKKLEDSLKDKRVFSIGVSHSHHFYNELDKTLAPYKINLYSLGASYALALLGQKAKLSSLVAEGLTWRGSVVDDVIESLKQREEKKAQVLEIENQSGLGFTPFFSESMGRIFDRAVIYWEDMDGYAFINELASETGKTLASPGEEFTLESPSLSRWGGVKTMDWLKDFGLSEKAIRGLVLISIEDFDANLVPAMKKVRDKILKMQSGD